MAAIAESALSVQKGTIKTFGEHGPMYEVLGDAGLSPTGEPLVTIRVVETGETLNYRTAAVLLDPEAV